MTRKKPSSLVEAPSNIPQSSGVFVLQHQKGSAYDGTPTEGWKLHFWIDRETMFREIQALCMGPSRSKHTPQLKDFVVFEGSVSTINFKATLNHVGGPGREKG